MHVWVSTNCSFGVFSLEFREKLTRQLETRSYISKLYKGERGCDGSHSRVKSAGTPDAWIQAGNWRRSSGRSKNWFCASLHEWSFF